MRIFYGGLATNAGVLKQCWITFSESHGFSCDGRVDICADGTKPRLGNRTGALAPLKRTASALSAVTVFFATTSSQVVQPVSEENVVDEALKVLLLNLNS